MNEIYLLIPGEPVAKARPRWAKFGMYTPKKTVNYETYVKGRFSDTYANFIPLTCPLKMEITAFFTIPNSIPKKKRAAMLYGTIRPDKRPDIENVAKTVMDALTQLAYDDDKRIVDLRVTKYYSDQPKVIVVIQTIKEPTNEI